MAKDKDEKPSVTGKDVLNVEPLLVSAEQAEDYGEKRRAGRKKGAKNKRSDALRLYCSGKFGIEPGELLIETVFREYNEYVALGNDPGMFMEYRAARLSETMGISSEEALKHVEKWMGDLLPYIHQKQPMAVEVDQRTVAIAFTMDGQNVATPKELGTGLDMRPANIRMKPSDPSPEPSDKSRKTPENDDESK